MLRRDRLGPSAALAPQREAEQPLSLGQPALVAELGKGLDHPFAWPPGHLLEVESGSAGPRRRHSGGRAPAPRAPARRAPRPRRGPRSRTASRSRDPPASRRSASPSSTWTRTRSRGSAIPSESARSSRFTTAWWSPRVDRAPAGRPRGEPAARSPSGPGSRRRAAELDAVAVSLLEVVADDLVALDELRAVVLEPAGEALVQVGARRLRERVVGRVADQQVAEAEAVLGRHERPLGPDQLLAYECGQPRHDLHVGRLERLNRPAVEELAFDRAALEHAPLGLLEPVEPGRKQRLQRPRHDHVTAGVGRHCGHLGEEQRIPARRPSDALAQVRPRRVCGQKLLDVLAGERLEPHERDRPAAAGGRREPRDAPCRRPGSAHRPIAVPPARRDRGRCPRPTGCRRRQRRAAPPVRAACGTPTRCRPATSPPRSGQAASRSRAATAGSRLGKTASSCLITSTTGKYVMPSP